MLQRSGLCSWEGDVRWQHRMDFVHGEGRGFPRTDQQHRPQAGGAIIKGQGTRDKGLGRED